MEENGWGAYLVIEPNAGSVPGINDATRLPAPSATSSRFGEMEYPKRDAFCLAETIESRKPMTEIKLNGRILSKVYETKGV